MDIVKLNILPSSSHQSTGANGVHYQSLERCRDSNGVRVCLCVSVSVFVSQCIAPHIQCLVRSGKGESGGSDD